MATIHVYVREEVKSIYQRDPSKKGLVNKLICEHYGIAFGGPKIIVKNTNSKQPEGLLYNLPRNGNSGVPVQS